MFGIHLERPLYHKNGMTTLWRKRVMSLTASVTTIRFLNEIMFILKAIK